MCGCSWKGSQTSSRRPTVSRTPLPCRCCTPCPDWPERQRPSPCRAQTSPCTSVGGETPLVTAVRISGCPLSNTSAYEKDLSQEKQGSLLRSITLTLHCHHLRTLSSITYFNPSLQLQENERQGCPSALQSPLSVSLSRKEMFQIPLKAANSGARTEATLQMLLCSASRPPSFARH